MSLGKCFRRREGRGGGENGKVLKTEYPYYPDLPITPPIKIEAVFNLFVRQHTSNGKEVC